jgi:hypothetical protein
MIRPDWVCKLRYYVDQWLVWLAIGALAFLAYQKDRQLDDALRKIEGLMVLEQAEHDNIERRMDTIVESIKERHP